ncbi:MAG: hypothetical protein OHK0052_02120 [Anaerolineales bacterium]
MPTHTPPIVKHLSDYTFFTAGDKCTLANVINPLLDADATEIDYSLAIAFIEPGKRTLKHALTVPEVYFVLEGSATIFLEQQSFSVGPGSCYYIPANCVQWVRNDGETRFRFVCIVQPGWTEDKETILE